jgi:ribose 5-phosphate isomerase A
VGKEVDPAKLLAARTAADLVQSGMTVGLGTGSTASLMVRRLGERIEQEGLRIIGVPTSVATAELARDQGIPLRELDDVAGLDINLDGADEVDPEFRMIKGRGGALLREKIVACIAGRRVTMITRIRMLAEGSPYRTDGGNAIIDCRFVEISDPQELELRMLSLVGVFETGLFLGLCDTLVVASADGVEVIESGVRRHAGCGNG